MGINTRGLSMGINLKGLLMGINPRSYMLNIKDFVYAICSKRNIITFFYQYNACYDH